MDAFFKSGVSQIPKAGGLAFGDQSIGAEVAASSYEACTFGIQFANDLETHLAIVSANNDHEWGHGIRCKYSHIVADIIRELALQFEKASVDEFYVDMTCMDKFFDCQQLRNKNKRPFDEKLKLQTLDFPEFITYNRNDRIRTKRINTLFALIEPLKLT